MVSTNDTAPSPDKAEESSPPAPPADSPPDSDADSKSSSSSSNSSAPPPSSSSPPPPPPPPEEDSSPPTPTSDPPSSSSSSNSSSSSSSSPPPPSSKSHSPPHGGDDDGDGSSGSPAPPGNKDVPSPATKHSPSTSGARHLAPPKSWGKDDEDDGTPSGNGEVNVPLVVGVTAGVAVFFVLLLVAFLCCGRKKRRHHHHRDHAMNYYTDGPRTGSLAHKSDYYYGGPPPSWHTGPPSSVDHAVKLPPPPGGGGGPWHAPPPPPPLMSSGEESAGYSGPHGPPLPPPSPTIALGFNKSTFTYDELAAATNGFSQANLLGQGGFGYVHKGVLPNGKEVAVKSLKSGSGQGEREFQAEVEIISRVHHRHLVSLVGYCIAGGQRMLVYEFVPNGTLEYHLHGKDRPTMDFPTRLKIALGSAKGLAYLHEDCHPKIIHRDIKAANILLDYKFEAMVADFGLAKLSSDTNTHVSTRVMGTFGYLAPEYASSGKLTEKSDVFSFGVMLLELITGRRPIDTTTMMEDSLVDWARPLMTRALTEGIFGELVDPGLEGNFNPGEMARIISCAAASVRHSGRRRPKMSQIVRALEGDSSLDDLNEGQSSAFSSTTGSSDYEYSGSYRSQMKKFERVALASEEFESNDYNNASSEYRNRH